MIKDDDVRPAYGRGVIKERNLKALTLFKEGRSSSEVGYILNINNPSALKSKFKKKGLL